MFRSTASKLIGLSLTRRCINWQTTLNIVRHVSSSPSHLQGTSQHLQAPEHSLEVPDPLKHEDFFSVHQLVTLRELFDARVHLGHKKGNRDQNMIPYIFGTRLGCDIIDLEQTLPLLRDALNFTAHIAFRKGVILFLSRHLQMMPHIESEVERIGEYAHCREWYRGTFTNANVQFGAITRLPDLCVFLGMHDTVFQMHGAIVEAAKMAIPSIGMADTSADPTLLTHVVPGNDDSPSAIKLYCSLFGEAVLRGKARRKEMEEQGLMDAI